MVHRGTTRESRNIRFRREHSSPEGKLRRHRNKMRIWRRAVRRLAQAGLRPEMENASQLREAFS